MKHPAGCRHPGEFLEGGLGVRDGAQGEADDHRVEVVIGKREPASISCDESNRGLALPCAPDGTMEHAAVIVDTDDDLCLLVVRDVQSGADGNLEDLPRRVPTQVLTLMAEAEAILGHHEEVVDPGKERMGRCGHVGQVRLRLMSAAPSKRTEIRRLPERGVYERDAIYAIIDEALICHVGFVHEGNPVVIPTIHARIGDTLYLHGSPASRMLRSMRSGAEISVNMTLVDGVVVARAAFHNSMNYRSVVVFGSPRIVIDDDEKWDALEAITDHVVPGRWADSRPMTEKEMKGTLVAALPLDESSAKMRTGGPKDDEADYGLPIWAGVIPLAVTPSDPIPDPQLSGEVAAPEYVADYRRPDL